MMTEEKDKRKFVKINGQCAKGINWSLHYIGQYNNNTVLIGPWYVCKHNIYVKEEDQEDV